MENEVEYNSGNYDFHLEEDLDEMELGGFTTAGSFSSVACWGPCVSTGSSFSSAGS